MRRTISESLVVSFLIALGTALVVGALGVLDRSKPVPPQTEVPISWPHVLLVAAAGGVAVLLAVWGFIWLWHFASYQLRGYKDDEWNGGEMWMQKTTASFLLKPKKEMPLAIPTECRVKFPSGNIQTFSKDEIAIGSGFLRMVDCPNTTTGSFEVTWYGSTKRGKPYEITRETFNIDDLDGGRYLV